MVLIFLSYHFILSFRPPAMHHDNKQSRHNAGFECESKYPKHDQSWDDQQSLSYD